MKISDVLTQVYMLRTEKSELNHRLKEIEEQLKSKEQLILDHFDALGEGMESFSNEVIRVTKTKQLVPIIENWENFLRTDAAAYMVQKRITASALQEYIDLNGEPPEGLATTEVAKLSFRKV